MNRERERHEMTLGESLLREGEQLQKMEVGAEQFYQTAIQVAKPRDLKDVEVRCVKEAEAAGDLFYYTWTVQGKRGPALIDGVSIHGAMAIARNFGNCAVPVSSEHEGEHVMFKAAFVDLETGFTVARIFRAHLTAPPRKFAEDPDQSARWYDMQFQKAQSQAQRNVILKGVPFYIVEKVRKAAHDSAHAEIRKMGLNKARKAALDQFAGYGVTKEALEVHLGVAMGSWTIQNVVNLRSILRALEEGLETVESVFGGDSAQKANQTDLTDRFWEHVDKKGIKRDDPFMVEHLEEVAKFANMEPAEYIAELVAAFNRDEGEVNKLMRTYLAKKNKKEKEPAEQKKKPPKQEAEKTEQKYSSILVWNNSMQLALDALGPKKYAEVLEAQGIDADKFLQEGQPGSEKVREIEQALAEAIAEISQGQPESQGEMFK